MMYAMGFIGLFTIGGLTGLFLATLAIDVHVHDTYFAVAHFHYIMVGGAVMGYLGGIHFWWPKLSRRLYPEGWGRFSALIIFVGFNLTFFPQFILEYFMHLRYSGPLPKLFWVAGLFWLAILLDFTMSDYLTRQWMDQPEGWAQISHFFGTKS